MFILENTEKPEGSNGLWDSECRCFLHINILIHVRQLRVAACFWGTALLVEDPRGLILRWKWKGPNLDRH